MRVGFAIRSTSKSGDKDNPSFSLRPTNLQLNSAVSIAANCESARIIALNLNRKCDCGVPLMPLFLHASAAFLFATRINLSSILGDDAPITSRPRSPSISRSLHFPVSLSLRTLFPLSFSQLLSLSLFLFSLCFYNRRNNVHTQ